MNVWLKLKYIYAYQFKHAEQTNGNKYMQNFTHFQHVADSCLKKDPFFLDFANSCLPLKKYPFFHEKVYENGTCTLWSGVAAGIMS